MAISKTAISFAIVVNGSNAFEQVCSTPSLDSQSDNKRPQAANRHYPHSIINTTLVSGGKLRRSPTI